MRTELFEFEAALYELLRDGAKASQPLPAKQWATILSLADREQVAPLLHAAITAAGTCVPESVRQVLALVYRRSGTASAEAYAQLADVLHALHAAGVPAVLLKGAALGRFAYRDAALRSFDDLDLLIRPEHVEDAHQALRGVGYVVAGERPSPADLRWRQARGYADLSGRRMPVDLHWRYAGYPLLTEGSTAGVFARARLIDVDGENALIPSPEDMLVALGIHFQRELWYGKPRLKYVRDTVEVVGRNAVVWHRLKDCIHEMPFARSPLLLLLEVARDLLDAQVPQEALRVLSKPGSGRVRHYLRTRVRRGLLRQIRQADAVLQIALLRWLDTPSVAAYTQWLTGLLFVPGELATSRSRWLRGFWGRKRPGAEWGGG